MIKTNVGQGAEIVQSMLGEIPELTKLKQVKTRDGRIVPFDAARLRQTIAGALKACSINDTAVLDRMLEQALGRLEREYDGHTVPTTDEVSEMVALVAIDNNLPFVAKRYLQKRVSSGKPKQPHKKGPGLRFERYFTTAGVHPFDEIEWELRDAVITNEKGKTVFEQRGVEVPKSWSETATNIVVSKYFRGKIG